MQPLPGFRDFLPEACAERNYIFARWREVARRYGFTEWDGPVLEATELYQKKSGPEIVEQLFHFVDKGQRAVALRPELTPTLARVVACHDREFRKPLKWFSIPQCFRYEKQQRGRLREHYQLNCDLIGDSSPAADAEMIALGIDLLHRFGFGPKDVVVRISDREFWIEFLRREGVAEERWPEILQAIDKSEREAPEKTREKLGALADKVSAVFAGGGNSDKLNFIMENLSARGLAEFAQIDVRIVRGLAYYTGVVFEFFDRAGAFRAIAGGGRYDNLISNLSDGAVALPAVGFAMGDVVLGELIHDHDTARDRLQKSLAEESPADVYVVVAKEVCRSQALTTIQQLRNCGYRVDYAISPAKVGRQFQAAEHLRASSAVIFGDEWPQVAVKNLSSGHQELVAPEDLLAHLSR